MFKVGDNVQPVSDVVVPRDLLGRVTGVLPVGLVSVEFIYEGALVQRVFFPEELRHVK